MPASRIAAAAAAPAALALAASGLAGAQPRRQPAAASERGRQNSSLDAPLFYQLLLGEIELRDGEAGTAYQVDARRRPAHARTSSCSAARPTSRCRRAPASRRWRRRSPGARRCPSRPRRCATRSSCWSRSTASTEAVEPLRSLLRQHAAAGAAGADRRAAALLRPRAPTASATAAVARAGAAAVRRRAGDTQRAGARRHRPRLARRRRPGQGARLRAARAATPTRRAEGPALLALELLPATPDAEAIVKRQLCRRSPDDTERAPALRAQRSPASQRYAEATAAARGDDARAIPTSRRRG